MGDIEIPDDVELDIATPTEIEEDEQEAQSVELKRLKRMILNSITLI